MRKGWRGALRGAGLTAALLLLTHCGEAPPTEEAADPLRRVAQPGEASAEAADPLRPVARLLEAQAFEAVANASVDASRPGDTALRVDAAPRERRAFLRFEVKGLAGRVRRATLRLHAANGTVDGPAVHATDSTWAEDSVTFGRQPARLGGALDDAGAVRTGTWVELDVTGAVTGNGTYSFGLYPTGEDGADFSPRGHADAGLRPQLVVETDATLPTAGECRPVTRYEDSVLHPVADGSVSPESSEGADGLLRVDASPRQEAYLRFQVEPGDLVVGAKLRLYAADGTSDGPTLHALSPQPWSREELTWTRRPSLGGAPLADVGAIASESWVELDVSAAVRGAGEVGFGLLPASGNGADFHSRHGARPELWPRLVVTRARTWCTYRGQGGGASWARQQGDTGDERAHVLAPDGSGGFVMAGQFTGSGNLGGSTFTGARGLVVARYGADGAHQWSRAYAVGSDAEAVGLAVTPGNELLLAGTYRGALDFGTGRLPEAATDSVFLVKLSSEGQPLWARGFGARLGPPSPSGNGPTRAWVRAVATDADGNLLVTGSFHGVMDLGGGERFAGPGSQSSSEPAPGIFLAKYAPDGRHLWSHGILGGYTGSRGRALAIDSAGNVLLGGTAGWYGPHGSILGAMGNDTPFVAKFSPDGALRWSRAFNRAWGAVTALAVLPGDAVGFAGDFGGTFDFGGRPVSSAAAHRPLGPDDMMLGTLSASGEDGWVRPMGDSSAERALSLAADASGHLVLGGSCGAAADLGGGTFGAGGLFVARYGPDGAHRWSRLLGTGEPGVALAVAPGGRVRVGASFTADGVVDGSRFASRGRNDVLLLEFAP